MHLTRAEQPRYILDALGGRSAAEVAARDRMAEPAAARRLEWAAESVGDQKAAEVVKSLALPSEAHIKKFENRLCANCHTADYGPFGCRTYVRAIAGDWSNWVTVCGAPYCRKFVTKSIAEAEAKAK